MYAHIHSVLPRRFRTVLLAGTAALCANSASSFADETVATSQEVVVSATRVETTPDKVGSSVTVISKEEIERRAKPTLIDTLAGTPGLTFTRTGGIGSTTQVKLRGGNPGQSQVLIDGIQLNDGASTDNSFDFDTLLSNGVERVEVLRGPQSALYGNDAMTGVVNVVTARGRGPMSAHLLGEYGSYGTARGGFGVSGGGNGYGYALNGAWLRTDGFSRVTNTTEKDGANQRGIHGAVNYDVTDNWTVDVVGGLFDGRTDYDNFRSDGLNLAKKTLRYGKIDNTVSLMDGKVESTLSLSLADTDRSYDEPSGWIPHTNYGSMRTSAELLTNISLRDEDVLTIGLASKRETAKVVSDYITVRTVDIDEAVVTNSIYGQYMLALGERLNVTFGLRRDDNDAFGGNNTYRVAAAYRLLETDTTLRASVGTGAKAPTLYQLYAPIYGNPNLRTEESVGADAGVEQRFLNGRLVGSVTGFWNRFENLINFENSSYVNVGKAHTEGVELAARHKITEDIRVKGSYTYMVAENDTTGRWLARRPRHSAGVLVDWTPMDGLDLGVTTLMVGKQLDSSSTNRENNAYTVMDFSASYAITDTVTVYGRVDNLFNADYEEVLGYNTPGRSAYAGFKIKM